MKPIFQIHQCLSEGDIQGYLGNRLSPEERHRVENHLLDCPLCTDALEGWELMAQEQPQAIPLKGRRIQWRFFAVAAAVLALMVAVVWVYSGSNSSDRLYAEYFDHYASDVDVALRGEGDGQALSGSAMEAGLESYSQGKYAEAATSLEAFLKETPNHLIARFYLGMAWMEEARWAEAETLLKQVQAAGGDYREEASWYLSLIYIKTNRPDEAGAILRALAEKESGRYYEEANKLLSKL